MSKSLAELTQEGLRVLYNELGVVDTVRFLNQFTTGFGNYTEERRATIEQQTFEQAVAQLRAFQETRKDSKQFTMDTARIFIHDNDQAICLPEGYRFEGTEVYIRKVGDAVVLSPVVGSWQTLIDSLGQFSDDFMENREQPDA